jgi:hypothetical protein
MQAHLAEHYAMKYFNEMNRQMGGQLPPPGSFSPEQPLDPNMERQIAQAAALIPQIQIMEPGQSFDAEEEDFQAEQRRKDEEHAREQDRRDEMALADINRQDLAALSKEDRDNYIAAQKEEREKRAAAAKEKREDAAAAAKIQRERKLAAAKPKPKAQSK